MEKLLKAFLKLLFFISLELTHLRRPCSDALDVFAILTDAVLC